MQTDFVLGLQKIKTPKRDENWLLNAMYSTLQKSLWVDTDILRHAISPPTCPNLET